MHGHTGLVAYDGASALDGFTISSSRTEAATVSAGLRRGGEEAPEVLGEAGLRAGRLGVGGELLPVGVVPVETGGANG